MFKVRQHARWDEKRMARPAFEPLERRAMLSGDGLAAAVAPLEVLPSEPKIYAPHSTVRGQTLGEWSAQWWQWAYRFNSTDGQGHPANPLTDPVGKLAYLGDVGGVFFLGGVMNISGSPVRTAVIPSGTPVFFPLLNVARSEFRGYGSSEADQAYWSGVAANCATNLHASIDGVEVANPALHREATPQFTFKLPDAGDNILAANAPAGLVNTAVSDGYWIMTHPLSLGEHTINFGGQYVFPPGFRYGPDPGQVYVNGASLTINATYKLTVVPQGLYEKGATEVPGVRGEAQVDAPAAAKSPFNSGKAIRDSVLDQAAEDRLLS